MVVTPTSLDDSRWRCPEFYVQSFGKGKLVCILLGSGSMEGVVRSQKFRDGTKQCWLMMGNHHWNWSALERKIRDRQGKVTDEKMKFMAIGEYDEFTEKWQLAMADYAVRSLPFEEQERFDQRLRQAVFADKQ